MKDMNMKNKEVKNLFMKTILDGFENALVSHKCCILFVFQIKCITLFLNVRRLVNESVKLLF